MKTVNGDALLKDSSSDAVKISAFDLDHTLLVANSSFHFGAYLSRKRYIPQRNLFILCLLYSLMAIGVLSIRHIHTFAFRLIFKGIKESQLKLWVREFLDDTFSYQSLYRPAHTCFEKAKQAGHHVVILSSSPSFLVEEIAKRLDAHRYYATTYSVDDQGKFINIEHIVLGADKATHLITEIISKNRSNSTVTAYTDSYEDLPLMNIADIAVGVNPDRRLRALCKQNGWSII